MGFFSAESNRTQKITSTTTTVQGGGVAAVGGSAVDLTTYNITKTLSPVIQSGSPGATATQEQPTLGGLNWQVWLLVGLVVIFIFRHGTANK